MTERRATFQAIGTHWDIAVNAPLTDAQWADLQVQIQGRIQTFDKNYSRFRADSLVTEMSKKAGTYKLPEDGFMLLHFYEQLYHATDGKVTPLVGQLLSDAGYDAAYSFIPKPLQRSPKWEDVITYDRHTITLSRPALLDFGAAGKGYLVDIVAALLQQNGVKNYTINAGGDIAHCSASHEKLTVGLENPFDVSEAVGMVEIGNQSLCASAGNKRAWQQFHHIVDPVSMQPVQQVAAVWVLAESTMLADGLATALFFTEPQKLRRNLNFSYALLGPTMELTQSTNFPAKLFTESAA